MCSILASVYSITLCYITPCFTSVDSITLIVQVLPNTNLRSINCCTNAFTIQQTYIFVVQTGTNAFRFYNTTPYKTNHCSLTLLSTNLDSVFSIRLLLLRHSFYKIKPSTCLYPHTVRVPDMLCRGWGRWCRRRLLLRRRLLHISS